MKPESVQKAIEICEKFKIIPNFSNLETNQEHSVEAVEVVQLGGLKELTNHFDFEFLQDLKENKHLV